MLLKIKVKVKSKLVVSVSQYDPNLFPDTLNYTPSFMRLILAKKTENEELKHIAGTFEVEKEKCCVSINEEQQDELFYVYVEMDQLIEENSFSVLIMADEVESMQEVEHEECPNFIFN